MCFFVKQKTAYEMRISDWSSDVCSSDLLDDSVQQIDQGLNAAYRQLRELLTTFRIKVNEPGLRPAVQATIEEFGANSGLQILSDYRLDHCPLTPNEEVHCLQIIREALSNVVKHAEADRCWLSLTQDSNGTIHVRIEDDGIGIRPEEQRAGHYGLIILQERASSLDRKSTRLNSSH